MDNHQSMGTGSIVVIGFLLAFYPREVSIPILLFVFIAAASVGSPPRMYTNKPPLNHQSVISSMIFSTTGIPVSKNIWKASIATARSFLHNLKTKKLILG